MPALAPFTPGSTIAITVSSSSAAVALPTNPGDQIIVTSLAANAIAYIAFGISSVSVTIPTGTAANGVPILPGTVNVFTVPPGFGYIATIGTSNNTLYVTGGDGS